MNNTGTIREAIDSMTDFINEDGKFAESDVDELNSLLFKIERWVEIELTKRDLLESGLERIIKNQLDSVPGSSIKNFPRQ